jgi:tryptophan-rich sensory protein
VVQVTEQAKLDAAELVVSGGLDDALSLHFRSGSAGRGHGRQWALQIALNTLWTPVFFGKRNIKGGMVVLAALWIAVAACMIALFRLDWIAGLLFLPYLAWVSTAGALNFSVMQLNPSEVR